MNKCKSFTVLDANAFILRSNILNLGATTRLVTTSHILQELRDLKTKEYILSFPFTIQTIDCDEEALTFVKGFAKKTGDISTLSQVDIQLIGITYMLYKREQKQAEIRKQPPPLQEKNHSNDINHYYNFSSSQKSQNSQQDTQLVLIQQKLQNIKQQKKREQEEVDCQKNVSKVESIEEGWISVPLSKRKVSLGSESNSDDQQGWITTKNYQKKMAEANSSFQEQPEVSKTGFQIFLVSADFAIQNVAIQMGIHLLSLDGRRIQSIRRFIYECYLCWKQFRILDQKVRLCSNCGYNSLSKISYSINGEGHMVLHRKKGWKPNQKILQVKERKLQEQERNKKHQHARKKKKASIFQN